MTDEVLPPEVSQALEESGGIENLRRMRPDIQVLKRLEDVYGLLSCSSRVEILFFLNISPMTPGLLSELTGMAPNLITFHLRKLQGAGVIEVRKEGKYRVYSLTDLGHDISGPLTV